MDVCGAAGPDPAVVFLPGEHTAFTFSRKYVHAGLVAAVGWIARLRDAVGALSAPTAIASTFRELIGFFCDKLFPNTKYGIWDYGGFSRVALGVAQYVYPLV